MNHPLLPTSFAGLLLIPELRLDTDNQDVLFPLLAGFLDKAASEALLPVVGGLFRRPRERDPLLIHRLYTLLRGAAVKPVVLANDGDLAFDRLSADTALSLVGAAGLAIVPEDGITFDIGVHRVALMPRGGRSVRPDSLSPGAAPVQAVFTTEDARSVIRDAAGDFPDLVMALTLGGRPLAPDWLGAHCLAATGRTIDMNPERPVARIWSWAPRSTQPFDRGNSPALFLVPLEIDLGGPDFARMGQDAEAASRAQSAAAALSMDDDSPETGGDRDGLVRHLRLLGQAAIGTDASLFDLIPASAPAGGRIRDLLSRTDDAAQSCETEGPSP